MKEIRVLGSTVTPEYLAGVAEARVLKNLVPAGQGPAYRKEVSEEAAEVLWAFTSTGGARGIYVRYSAHDEAPCKLIVNGKVEQRKALFEPTLGVADWRYQTTVDLPAGESRIALRLQGGTPEIEAIAVAAPPVGRQAGVDDAYAAALAESQRSKPRRPLVLRPAELAGLVEVARRAVNDPAAYAQLNRVLGRVLLAARWDSEEGSARIAWGGGPLNGQRVRQAIFNRLMALDVDAIVETGAYIGSSTSFFARQGVPVFSCELQEKHFGRATAHLAEWPNVTLHLDDSRSFLRSLAADPAFAFQRPLFYLDAHWEDDVPLAEEVRIIAERWRSFVIMVDDFQVPGSDYVYAKYANGLELTLDYLEREGAALDDLAILFPSIGPEAETGAKCGTLILMPLDLYEQRLTMDRTLFRHHRPPARHGAAP